MIPRFLPVVPCERCSEPCAFSARGMTHDLYACLACGKPRLVRHQEKRGRVEVGLLVLDVVAARSEP